MARGQTIKFLRTTRANLETQKTASGLILGEPYLITDENRIAIATAVNAYYDFALKSELPTLLRAVKTADETVNNSAIMQDDDHLTVTVEANTNYILDCIFIIDTTSAASWRAQFNAPTGTTLGATEIRNTSTFTAFGSGGFISNLNTIFENGAITYTGVSYFHLSGALFVGSTGGTFNLQWAQGIATAVNTILKKGSHIKLIKV